MLFQKAVLFFLLFSVLSCSPRITPSATPKSVIKNHPAFPSKYVAARNVDVWLPAGYEASAKQRYSVLIMHDGQMLYDSTTTWNHQEWGVDEIAEKLLQSGQIEPFIVVGVWNTPKRFAEYMPQKPMAALPDSLLKGLRNYAKDELSSDLYLRFLTEELLPFIQKNYQVKSDKSHTFIAGSSMGGLISMYAICEYPNVFGGAACLSTHWPVGFNNDYPAFPNALIDYFSNHLPDPKSHKIYFDYGSATLDSLYQPHQLRMDAKMAEKGYQPGKNWLTQSFPGADHSEKAWRERLHIPLTFLFSK